MSLSFLGFGPGGWSKIFDLVIGGAWQAAQDVRQVFMRVDAMAAAASEDRINDRAVPSRIRMTDEKKVFLAQGRWPNGILD